MAEDTLKKITLTMAEPEVRLAQAWTVPEVAHLSKTVSGLPDDRKKDYRLSVGDRPVPRSMKKLYELYNKPLPPDIASLNGDVYLIVHAVGLLAEKKAGATSILGYQASFADRGSTIELYPSTQFKELLSVELGFSAGVKANGHAEAPNLVANLGKEILDLGVGGKMEISTDAKVLGKLSLSVKTPTIQSVGHSSSAVS
jgi:hypothetical protein